MRLGFLEASLEMLRKERVETSQQSLEIFDDDEDAVFERFIFL